MNKNIIATIIASSMPKKQLELHQKVVEKFIIPDTEYVQFNSPRRYTTSYMSSSVNHAGNIDRIIRNTNYENYLFLEIDAIPTKNGVFELLFENAQKGILSGPAQRTQWECKANEHVYVAPCALAISMETYKKMGEPSAHPTDHGDTAEEYTYVCEKMGIPIIAYMPISTDGPKKWRLKDGIMYGAGTTYECGIWHKFSEDLNIDFFYKKCEETLNNK